ncbi:MAG: hypothetical protein ACKVW3_09235 [Phycisphaerales bacterium]
MFASIILGVFAAYAGVGVAFCVAFLARGLRRVDHSSQGSHWLFHVLIVPGVVALWPLLLRMWVMAGRGRA